ncbi:MAG TPA: class I SAM-dependent methyltransferase, partial [Bacteroidales bacterium]|nr:class I SAM-dependent methyltransferase [Bacteroidales bacterium]
MEILTPTHWTEYELIDSGGQEKLERFGKYVLVRPEPQAVWMKSMPETEWQKQAHARYDRTRGGKAAGVEGERGAWIKKPSMPDQWTIGYRYGSMDIRFRLGLTAFGHIGVFPEQAVNWEYIYDVLSQASPPSPLSPGRGGVARVLNLFAYTGGSSLAARAAGADVVHVDSVKPVITWAREMMEASGLDNIRWVVEDAMNFVRREVKRGNRYDGIILDPPAYGRGPDGEKWLLGDSIDELIALCHRLLEPGHGFMVLSLYSMGYSALIAENLVKSRFGEIGDMQSGEMYVTDRAGRKLPLGTFL